MRSQNTSRGLRITAGIMGLMMLIIVLFSAFFIAVEAGHECTGEGCPICACIQQCEDMLRRIGDRTAVQLSAIPPVLSILFFAALFVAELPQETLITRKVRLNN